MPNDSKISKSPDTKLPTIEELNEQDIVEEPSASFPVTAVTVSTSEQIGTAESADVASTSKEEEAGDKIDIQPVPIQELLRRQRRTEPAEQAQARPVSLELNPELLAMWDQEYLQAEQEGTSEEVLAPMRILRADPSEFVDASQFFAAEGLDMSEFDYLDPLSESEEEEDEDGLVHQRLMTQHLQQYGVHGTLPFEHWVENEPLPDPMQETEEQTQRAMPSVSEASLVEQVVEPSSDPALMASLESLYGSNASPVEERLHGAIKSITETASSRAASSRLVFDSSRQSEQTAEASGERLRFAREASADAESDSDSN